MFREQFCNKIAQTDSVWQEILPNFHQNRTVPATQFPAWGLVFCWYLVWVQGRSAITKPRVSWPQSLANQKLVTLVTIWGTWCRLSIWHLHKARGAHATLSPHSSEWQWPNKLPSILIYWLVVWRLIAHFKLPGVILKYVRKVPIYGRSVCYLVRWSGLFWATGHCTGLCYQSIFK